MGRPVWMAMVAMACSSSPAVVDGGPADGSALDAVAPDSGPPASDPEPILGTLAEVGTCEAPAGFTCTRYEVSCPGVAPMEVGIRRGAPEGTRAGTIVFGSGNRGTTFWGGNGPDDDPLPWGVIADLRAAGYETVERAWVNRLGGWFAEAEGAGLAGATCRYATILANVIDATPASLPVCGMGSSAGTLELGYALTFHDLDDRVDFAMFSGGTLHRLDLGCTADWDCASEAAEYPPACADPQCGVGELADGIDAVHEDACSANESLDGLFEDSLAALSTDRLRLATETSFQWGDGDCLVIAVAGRPAADLFEAAGTAVTRLVVPDTGHSAQRTVAGAANIRDELLRGCVR